MGIKIEGLKQAQRAIKKYPKEFKKALRGQLIFYGNKMKNHALSNHRYTRKSGSLDRSIEAIVPKQKVALKFWINPKLVTSGKFNYGLIQHEGSYKGYRKSKAAKGYSRSKPKTGYGVRYDHFIIRAWDKYINKLQMALKKQITKTAKKVGL